MIESLNPFAFFFSLSSVFDMISYILFEKNIAIN